MPSNQSIHVGLDTSSYMDRPSMKQDAHPAHNMPTATEHYDGTINDHGRGASLNDASQRGRKDSPLQEGMPVTPQGDLPYGAYD